MARPRAPATEFGSLRYLSSRVKLGIKFGLETIRALVARLDHPEHAYPTLLVAGTNGKGSVTAYVAAALHEGGLRVGRYTSPHLLRVNERIEVAGRAITDRALGRALADVSAAGHALGVEPTYFEALTAAALVHFRRARVEVAVLEVGMGGRLDATAVASPLASAIVSIARDHEAYLGTTLRAIAREKAGVLRRGRTTVLGRLPAVARHAIAREARRSGARLLDAHAGAFVQERPGGLRVTTKHRAYAGLRPLPGVHQHENVLVALRLLEQAKAAGLRVDLGAAAAGINRTRWPGRLQWVPGRPPLLFDGAHNPAAALALAAYLREHRPFVLLFGVMADKDVEALSRTLFPLAHAVVLTRPAQRRAADPATIARRAGRVAARAHQEPSPRRALALARSLAAPDMPVVVAGSLYLVGELMGIAARRHVP